MKIPNLLQIESSTACNARCVFCPHPKMKRKHGTMTDELFCKILDEADELGITMVLLFLNGEPFAFPRIFDWMEKLRERGLLTVIFTNAALMTEEKSIELLSFSDIIQDIVFSIAGVDKESLANIMGLDYDVVVSNVRRFYTLNNGTIPTKIHMPRFSMTDSFVTEWQEQWADIEPRTGATHLYNFAGLIHDDMELRESSTHKYAPCKRLNHLAILWDGRVCLCCMDAEGQVILGDANTQSLSSIFNGEIYEHYRKLHSEERYSELPLCKDCNMH